MSSNPRIEDHSMLVKLKIPKWSPSVSDVKATKIIEDAAPETPELDESLSAFAELGGQAPAPKKARKAGKFKKWLIDTDNRYWQAIISAEGRARKASKALTLRWAVDGCGVLPAVYVPRYRPTLEPLKEVFLAAVEEFMEHLDELIEERRVALEPIGLFSLDDYPSRDKIRAAFRFEYEIIPMPASMVSDDLLNQLGEADRAEIAERAQMGATSIAIGMETDLLERVSETVGYMAERLANPTAVFRDSLVENIRGLVTTLGDLNVMGNEEIATIREQMNIHLTHDPQELRDNPELRRQTATVATEIAATAFRRIQRVSAIVQPSAAPTDEEIAERQAAVQEGLAVVRGVPITPADAVTTLAEATPETRTILDVIEQAPPGQVATIMRENTEASLAHLREGLAVHAGHVAPELVEGLTRAANDYEASLDTVPTWSDSDAEDYAAADYTPEPSPEPDATELAASPSPRLPYLFE